MKKRPLILFGALAGLGFLLLNAWRPFPGISGVEGNDSDAPHFPTVSGNNLNRQEFTLPQGFAGERNIVIVAFQEWQQQWINVWIPAAQQIESEDDSVRYYELPTLWEMGAVRRTFLNEGMRAGIPDPLSRQRTITLYLDKEAFKTSLQIESESTPYVFIVDQQGTVLWQESGEFTEEKGAALRGALGLD